MDASEESKAAEMGFRSEGAEVGSETPLQQDQALPEEKVISKTGGITFPPLNDWIGPSGNLHGVGWDVYHLFEGVEIQVMFAYPPEGIPREKAERVHSLLREIGQVISKHKEEECVD